MACSQIQLLCKCRDPRFWRFFTLRRIVWSSWQGWFICCFRDIYCQCIASRKRFFICTEMHRMSTFVFCTDFILAGRVRSPRDEWTCFRFNVLPNFPKNFLKIFPNAYHSPTKTPETSSTPQHRQTSVSGGCYCVHIPVVRYMSPPQNGEFTVQYQQQKNNNRELKTEKSRKTYLFLSRRRFLCFVWYWCCW